MASRRLRPMTVDDIAGLPEACASCAFWESTLADLAAPREHRDAVRSKFEWAETVVDHWGYCGVVSVLEEEIIGYLMLAPAAYVPRLGAFATTPVSPDAVVVVSGQVLPGHRGHGVGRQLVQAAAGLMARRDIRAMEAVGTYREGPSCLLPAAWLSAVGFTVVRPHPTLPRMRMDLQTTVRWRPDLGAAWHRLAGLVAQPAPPEPAANATHEGN